MRKLIVTLSLFLAFVVVLSGAVGAYFWQWLNAPIAYQAQYLQSVNNVYRVERGSNLTQIANVLAREQIIEWPKVWVLYARASQKTAVKVGEYKLLAGDTPLVLLNRLVSGDVVSYSVTLIEGSTFKDFLTALHAQEKLQKTLARKTTEQILADLNLDIQHPEGWFFPDTYNYIAGDSDADILKRAHKTMRKVLDTQWQARAQNLPYTQPYEALIMASIVEKETGVPYERDEIAGVFIRRLQKRMRLQTDPTVIYGMGENYAGNITRKDLRTPTPYNTYVIKGLPPTPIAMPGKEAIYAALHPADGEHLYFVAKGDGSHYFSSTLDEHLAAVAKYQKRRTSNYRSAPPVNTPTKNN
ncbi:endolytic transglycosylase MltG [Saccharophagus degradans]|uniref:Endolytic murein transglycosylase n=1 Tax=Saccharophagus degradans (strain 2-40 / ATCC 43961 / DSM 17024) TaxID=203122 RepID=Q21K84_SACD2|nr:endolytic transglycosylase MltG [Saccharophagus degradans]ABD80895.1 aminodeoxychorismate lyase [Saccharophagus degradans 2-40]